MDVVLAITITIAVVYVVSMVIFPKKKTSIDIASCPENGSKSSKLAGDACRTRIVHSGVAMPDDISRHAQKGYQSKLARDAAKHPDTSEYFKIGDMVGGRYQVAAIHHGGMGVVYGCIDHQTKLPRALKTVRNRYAHDKQMLSLFESEAAVWISLEKHPYIVRAYLVERFNNLPYVIAEYISGPEGMGGDLLGWLGHPRLTLPVAVAMALQIAQGMQHAVRKVPNLVHRDLKPGNILVSGDGKAMVTDFGLVNAAQSGAGTPAYMSPEQWRAETLDPRSDIYSYGCILFEMFTAHRLFPALSEQDWESAHLNSVPAALTSLVPEVPSKIDRFVRRCLEKEPRARPQSWDEIVAFLAEWHHRLTGKAVVLDFSSLVLDAFELVNASYSFLNLKRYEDVILTCERALAIDKNMLGAWMNKGAALRNLKRHEEAIQAYDRALAIDQNDARVWYNKGLALDYLMRHEEAIQAYDRSLVIDQNHARVWMDKGNALDYLKRHEEAIQAYDRALAIDPNDARVWMNKGAALRNLKRYEEVIQACDRALVIDQNVAAAWMNKGLTLHDLERYKEAIQAYDHALVIDQNDAEMWMQKSRALLMLKRFAEAIQVCDRALAIDQKLANAWSTKGVALFYLNHYDEAIQDCNRALAIDPANELALLGIKSVSDALNGAEAWNSKGIALFDLKHYSEALQAYDRALAIDQNIAMVWMNKGNVLSCLQRYEEAIQIYDRALVIDPNYVAALFNKGRTLLLLKRYEEAIQAFNRALTIDPTNDLALRGSKIASDALKAAK